MAREDVMKFESLNPRTGQWEAHTTREAAVSAMLRSAASQTQPKPIEPGWPDPSPLGDELPPVSVFDFELLPAAFRPFVEDVSERMQTPPDFAAAALVVSLAGCVNRRACIVPKRADRSWRVVPNLWGALVAPPGMMKSPLLRLVTLPLSRIEERWRAEFQSQAEDFALEKEKAELRWQSWREDFKRAMKKNADPPIEPDQTLTRPVQRRLTVTDATFEKLHEILAENPAGIFLVRDELTGWLSTLDRQGREGERGFMLSAWNGDTGHTIDRIERGSVHVPAVCVSLFGNIQPSKLRWYLSQSTDGGPGDDGLFQRFQVLIWPDVSHEWRLVDRPADDAAIEQVSGVLSTLAELSADTPVVIRFDDGAQELFFAWLTELEMKLRSGRLPEPLVAHLSKYRSLMPTLAGLFEMCARACTGGIEGDLAITLDHARRAAAFCDYLESHAKRVYSCLVSPAVHAAHELAREIRAGNLPGMFAARDIYRHHWSGLDTPERVQSALEILEDAGWVRSVRIENPSGGRPSETWMANPKLGGAE
jgi:putative DNA primase/helicase